MSIIIPEVEFEIGHNLYLRIRDVSYLPAVKGCTSCLPEDSYEDEPAEVSWDNNNACIIIYKKEKGVKKEYEFSIDDNLCYHYYEQIIEAIEEMEE